MSWTLMDWPLHQANKEAGNQRTFSLSHKWGNAASKPKYAQHLLCLDYRTQDQLRLEQHIQKPKAQVFPSHHLHLLLDVTEPFSPVA